MGNKIVTVTHCAYEATQVICAWLGLAMTGGFLVWFGKTIADERRAEKKQR